MPHPLIDQLRFTRTEWLRALVGVSEKDGIVHHGQMNSISWIVGHLGWQEQRYFLQRAQHHMPRVDVQRRFRFGAAMSTPTLADSLAAWREITVAADPFLDKIRAPQLLRDLPTPTGRRSGQSLGSAIRRLTYHYWFHIGEILAIRQLLAQKKLPQFVGDIEGKAPYRPEPAERPRSRAAARGARLSLR